jgi:NADP-dependent 3-hydroxy acid dehydrogenase YdfG
LAARNKAALGEVARECRKLGAEALVVVTDVSQYGYSINLANAAKDWKGLDVWINNAGILAAGFLRKRLWLITRRERLNMAITLLPCCYKRAINR